MTFQNKGMGGFRKLAENELLIISGGEGEIDTSPIVVQGTYQAPQISVYSGGGGFNFGSSSGNSFVFGGGSGGVNLGELLTAIANDPDRSSIDFDGDGIDDLDGAIIVALESNDNSGFFVCGGVGYFGGVGGICGANNPNDIYLYLGAGTPGPTLNLGIATDTTAYLGDFSGSYVSPTGTGAGLSGDLQNSTIMFGTPGASITFGISVVDSANAIVSIYNNFENTFAGGFVDQYYPSGNSYENVVEQ